MRDRLSRALLRLLRAPPEPRVPVDARSVGVFRAAPGYFRYRMAVWAIAQLGALIGVVGGLSVFSAGTARADDLAPILQRIAGFAALAAPAALVAQAAFSLAVLRLDYGMRWYILSDRSLRIREGILTVREKTMTFANIQQISIRQNPIQRLLGIADVEVRSAGGGSEPNRGPNASKAPPLHVAHFRGVDNAEEIRAAIRERVRLHRDAGLGDPDEPPPLPHAPTDVLAAARELRDEMRKLRQTLEAARARK
ncbi:MAG TPA: PH domain-containing protein [Longimicrobiales bacterium]